MEIKRKKKLSHTAPLIALTLLSILLTQGCATGRNQRAAIPITTPSHSDVNMPGGEPQQPTSEVFGPAGPEPKMTYGPAPVVVKPVVLVLGPGLARGFAYVGVIRALSEAKIPIGAIVSSEMGSLIGALYAMSTNLNQFEWSLLKFKEEVFQQPRNFLGRSQPHLSNGETFEAKLREIFHSRNLSESRIPIKMGLRSKKSGSLMMVNQGNAVKALRAAMASPRLFSPVLWTHDQANVPTIAVEGQHALLIEEGRALGLGPVVAVDVLSDTEKKSEREELRGADLVLRPKMSGISSLDFKKRTEAAYKGKAAVAEHLEELKHLVGLPPAR